ncbi:hypothetical protein ABZX90_30320 [Streptomyces sp. NPDC002935]|uniref:hypothetical protein n=1 Tax=unclassified Streptomyces TaxID=2593676 RepID=UPI00331979B6
MATRGRQLEAVRVVAQGHAYRSDQPEEARRQWAKLSLLANRRMQSDSGGGEPRGIHQDFMLRMWVIDQLGPDRADPEWNPETLASETLAALDLPPSQARALADGWRDLAIEQIRELRRHKNLTAHLDWLVTYMEPSPARDQLLVWVRLRRLLP